MNGSCAGGTGAFIDQMATLLGITPAELDQLSLGSEKLYSIASRCGVFAKSDIQPLLNQGARREDVAASIFQAVVNQTIAGLAQGRPIRGKVLFLGGPLFFFEGLRRRFVETLKLSPENAVFPETADVFVALGAACYAGNTAPLSFEEVMKRIENASTQKNTTNTLEPLFRSQEEYDTFVARHEKDCPPPMDADAYTGRCLSGGGRRLHHYQADPYHAGRRPAVHVLCLQRGQSCGRGAGTAEGNLPPVWATASLSGAVPPRGMAKT